MQLGMQLSMQLSLQLNMQLSMQLSMQFMKLMDLGLRRVGLSFLSFGPGVVVREVLSRALISDPETVFCRGIHVTAS